MTTYGIERNYEVTPYKVLYFYSEDLNIEYRFSSQLAMEKFVEGRFDFYDKTMQSLENRFCFLFKLNHAITDVAFYKRCEGRGYSILVNGGEIKWPRDLEVSGGNMKPMS